MYRQTYVKININNIKSNIEKIINKYNNYDYYFGVVKAFCYGHDNIEAVGSIIDGGCNYLAVATLDEAILVRNVYKDIPILCLGVIDSEFIDEAIKNNITLTVNSLDYAKEVVKHKNATVHIKVNTGMNRLGINNKEEIDSTYELLNNNNVFVEGVYSHIYESSDKESTIKQFKEFERLVDKRILDSVKIVHIGASDTITGYDKPSYVNGCRLGIIMYGFTNDKQLDLHSTFSMFSKVIQINELKKGDTLGYNGAYTAKEDIRIAVVCAGYADGIIRENTNRSVYINDKEYFIIGNICMDMLFVKVDNSIKVGDEVVLLKDNKHIDEVARYLNTIPYEIMCTISKRVPRIIEK